jgi:hypothetical protein
MLSYFFFPESFTHWPDTGKETVVGNTQRYYLTKLKALANFLGEIFLRKTMFYCIVWSFNNSMITGLFALSNRHEHSKEKTYNTAYRQGYFSYTYV